MTAPPPPASDPPPDGTPRGAGAPARGAALLARLRAFPASGGLILVTVLVFLGQLLSDGLFGFDVLLAMGAKSNAAIVAGQYWRFLTPIFLHIGLLHLFVNMYSLYVIGPPVEGPYGPARFLLVYFISGVGGVTASLAFSAQPSAGSSGAIFGLLGALGGFLYNHRHLFGSAAGGQLRHIVLVAMANLAIGLSPEIDNWGHLGGLIAGVVLALLLGPRFQRTTLEPPEPPVVDGMRGPSVWRRAALAALALGVLSWLALSSPFAR